MNDNLPLENLPEYLKNHRNGDPNGSPVIGMGQIVVPRTHWVQNIAFFAAAFLIISVASVTTYNTILTRNFTVVLDTNNASPELISSLVKDNGGQIVSVKQNGDSTYEVKLTTRKNINALLDLLRKNKDVKRVELGE